MYTRYPRYLLPSLRYHLTVHTVHKTHLDELDLIAQRYLKRWLGVPARGATAAGMFSAYLLGVKLVSQVGEHGVRRGDRQTAANGSS